MTEAKETAKAQMPSQKSFVLFVLLCGIALF
jgi:hypothetical protein